MEKLPNEVQGGIADPQRGVRNVDFDENAYDLRVFCWVGWRGVLGRGVRGEGKPSARGGSRDEVHLKVSPDFQAEPSILDPFRSIFDVFGPT